MTKTSNTPAEIAETELDAVAGGLGGVTVATGDIDGDGAAAKPKPRPKPAPAPSSGGTHLGTGKVSLQDLH